MDSGRCFGSRPPGNGNSHHPNRRPQKHHRGTVDCPGSGTQPPPGTDPKRLHQTWPAQPQTQLPTDWFIPNEGRNAVHWVTGRLDPGNGQGLSLRRARSTWQVAHLVAGTPVAVLQENRGASVRQHSRWAAQPCRDRHRRRDRGDGGAQSMTLKQHPRWAAIHNKKPNLEPELPGDHPSRAKRYPRKSSTRLARRILRVIESSALASELTRRLRNHPGRPSRLNLKSSVARHSPRRGRNRPVPPHRPHLDPMPVSTIASARSWDCGPSTREPPSPTR